MFGCIDFDIPAKQFFSDPRLTNAKPGYTLLRLLRKDYRKGKLNVERVRPRKFAASAKQRIIAENETDALHLFGTSQKFIDRIFFCLSKLTFRINKKPESANHEIIF
jgi:hypothetical protein